MIGIISLLVAILGAFGLGFIFRDLITEIKSLDWGWLVQDDPYENLSKVKNDVAQLQKFAQMPDNPEHWTEREFKRRMAARKRLTELGIPIKTDRYPWAPKNA